MNLFLKIFLWFLAAIALMVGVVVFLNWTVQTEPVASRWQNSVRNQMNIFAATATQIHDSQGDAGLREFIDRIKTAETISDVQMVGRNGKGLFSDVSNEASYAGLIERTFASRTVQIELSSTDSALAAKDFALKNGDEFAFIVRWERPRTMAFFGESRLRYVRLIGLLLTAIAVCYALALYLSSPIGKLRMATQKLADGDLTARVADQIGNRHDELAALAKDFDVMAERIESLINSQKRLSRDVSHELRSPLARMNVALEIAKQKSNADTDPMLARIETESTRLNEMISNLLTLSKLETGSQDFERHDVNLTSLIERIVSDASFEADANGKSVKIVGSDDCRVVGSEMLLRSAIENVLRNAVRYTKAGTSVEVSLKTAGGKANVTIRDHGDGVPEDELGNVFRPFYRVGEARERKTGGIGLGLAIAEQAIRAHKGTIKAANTGDGLIVEIVLNSV